MKSTLPFATVNLEQGTDEWRRWRTGVIGASDAPAIMGENPWKTRSSLLDEKLGRTPPFVGNAATRRGVELEPFARERYIKTRRVSVAPLILQHKEREWQIASVDGISKSGKVVVEIKCGSYAYKYTRDNKKPPKYYFGQLQHTLAITHLDEIDFYCYLPDERPILIKVSRDDDYISNLIEAELDFLYLMRKGGSKNISAPKISTPVQLVSPQKTRPTSQTQAETSQLISSENPETRQSSAGHQSSTQDSGENKSKASLGIVIHIVSIGIGASIGGPLGALAGLIFAQVFMANAL